jgi:hypothetical protein
MPTDDTHGNNGRAPGGTFAPGNKFGRGNPSIMKMHALRNAMLDAVPMDRLKVIIERTVQLAEGGDLEAVKILLAYAIGKPPATVLLAGPEGEPIGLDWSKVQAAVLAALAPFGADAKIAVALALRGVVSNAPAE